MKSYLALIDLRDSALSLGKLEFAATCETDMRLMIEEQHHYALQMDRVISTGQGYDKFTAGNAEWLRAAHESWMSRRKPVRDAACGYKDAFVEFHHATDHDTFTGACIAWLNMMDSAHFENRMHDERVARQVYIVTYSHPNGDVTTHGKFPHAARQSAYNLAAAMDKQYCAPGHEIYVDIQ